MIKYYFDLGSYDKNVDAFKTAVTVLNKKYGYPDNQGTITASDMYINPDGIRIAMDVPTKEDTTILVGGIATDVLDSSWDQSTCDQSISKNLAQSDNSKGGK